MLTLLSLIVVHRILSVRNLISLRIFVFSLVLPISGYGCTKYLTKTSIGK